MDLVTIVNKKDHILGYKPKEKVHKEGGILHRAVTVFVINKKGEILISKRSKNKKLWPLFWETSCSTDVTKEDVSLAKKQGRDVYRFPYILSAQRRLKEELRIDCAVKFLLKFQYKEKYKSIGAENEICALLIANYNNKIKFNQKEIKDAKFISLRKLGKDIEKEPNKYTPWLKIALEKYQEKSFDISSYIKETNQKIDDFTLKFLKKLKKDKVFPYSPVSHLPILRMNIPKARCALLRLLYESAKSDGDWEEIIPLAAALELYGNSTYVLDDIFDNQYARIGDSATWQKFGLNKGIIVGIIQRDVAAKMALERFKNNPDNKILEYFEEMDYFLYLGQYLNEDLLENSTFENYRKRTELISIDPYYFSKMLLNNLKISKKEKDLFDNIVSKWRYLAMIRNDFMSLSPEEIKRQARTKMLQGKTFEDIRKGLWVWPIIYFFRKAKASSKEKKFVKTILGNEKAGKKDLLEVVRILMKTGSLKAFLKHIKDKEKEIIGLVKSNLTGFERRKWIDFVVLAENVNTYYREIKKFFKIR